MKGHKLVEKYDKYNELSQYWTDGKTVYYCQYEIKNADIDTFEQFAGAWAKDERHCYSGSTRLKDADAKTFEALNFTYAKDKSNVWTLRGRISEADAETFVACDNGRNSLGINMTRLQDGTVKFYESFVPYGFGKDKNKVYYYDFDGKPNIVKKAMTNSFVSMNDGDHFGYDEASVFYGRSCLSGANPKTWKKLSDDYYYSRDRNKIFYFNHLIKDADAETFEVVVTPCPLGTPIQLAKDKNNYYWNANIISKEKFDEEVKDTMDFAKSFNEEYGR